jgi:hypothetical protein
MSVAGFDCGDGSSITAGVELGHGGFGEVAAVGDLPFVVHVGQHGADEVDDGGRVAKDRFSDESPSGRFDARSYYQADQEHRIGVGVSVKAHTR